MKSVKDKLYPIYHQHTVNTKLKMQRRYNLSRIHNKSIVVLNFESFRHRLIYLTKSSCEIVLKNL